MHGTTSSAALVLAGALFLSGCAAGGGTVPTSRADACATLQTALRDVANGAQNTLAAVGTPSEIQAKLEGYSERAAALAEEAENPDVADALAAVNETLSEAATNVATLPTDAEGALDADAVAEQQAAIQEAADKVRAACGEQSPSPTDG